MINFHSDFPKESPKPPENPNVLHMPQDPIGDIAKRLLKKSLEYRARLEKWTNEGKEARDEYKRTHFPKIDPYLDSLYKLLIAERLLDDDSADLNQIREEIVEKEGSLEELEFENAWRMIKKHINGEGGIIGGTGF